MTSKSVCLAALLLFGTGNVLLADEIDINKFEEVDNGNHNSKGTSAEVVYLTTDGTEGKKGDAGVVPAIKVKLSPKPPTSLAGVELLARIDHLVMPDVVGKGGGVSVDVWASPDFKRVVNKDPNSQVNPGDYNGYLMNPPDMDFWIIGSHHTVFSDLKPGAWTHVEGKFNVIAGGPLEFHVPPGTGFIYLKNFVAKP